MSDYGLQAESEMWDEIVKNDVPTVKPTALHWTKNPGGKRYTATTPRGTYRLIRQNTATGAKPWRATIETGGTTYRVIDTHYLNDAKAACEARDIDTLTYSRGIGSGATHVRVGN